MKFLLDRAKQWPLWRDMTAKAYRIAFISCLGAVIYGYDVSWWGSVLGMPSFTQRYGIYDAATDTYSISAPLQSAGTSIPTAGLVIGSLMTPFLSDRYGRRNSIAIMSVMFIIAIIVEVTSNSFWQIVIGRLLNSIPQGIAATLLPMYQSECAPASCRGGLVSIYTWFLDVGAVTATGIIYNTYDRPDSSAYKIVMGVQMAYPVLMLAFVTLIPETPRFLCMQGKRDEALEVLKSLRISPEIAEQEVADIESALNIHEKDSSWGDIFKGSNLRRTIISCTIPVIEAWQGLSFIGNYMVVFFIAIGFPNVYQLVVLMNAVLLMTLTFFFWVPVRFGRRPLLLAGSFIMGVTMFCIAGAGGTSSTVTSDARKTVCVAMLFIWAITYSSTWANLSWVTLAEISTTKLKAKTSTLGYTLQSVSGIIITLISPYMQNADYAGWGPYIGFFFGSFSFIGFIFVYFCFPETKGASIEELDLFFEQGLSIKEFSSAKRGDHAIQRGVTIIEGHPIEEGSNEKDAKSTVVKYEV